MKKIVKTALASMLLIAVMALGVVALSGGDVAFAAPSDGVQGGVDVFQDSLESRDLGDIVKNVINVLLYVIGIIAVVMLIVGGFKYITSGGAGDAVTSAKNTILYAIIGLVVALLAYSIVNFVLGSIFN